MTNATDIHRQYRLAYPTLAINFTGRQPCLITVPVGSDVEVIDAPQYRARFVEAWWGEQALYVLRSDLDASIARTARAAA